LNLNFSIIYFHHHHDGILDYPRYCAMISKALDLPKLSLRAWSRTHHCGGGTTTTTSTSTSLSESFPISTLLPGKHSFFWFSFFIHLAPVYLTYSLARRLYLIRRDLPVSLSKLPHKPLSGGLSSLQESSVLDMLDFPSRSISSRFQSRFLCVRIPYFKFPISRILDSFSFPNISESY